MKLHVSVGQGVFTDGYYYRIEMAGKRTLVPSEKRRLRALQKRIATMARREIGNHFLGVFDETEFGKSVLYLKVKFKTSKDPRVKFKLRSLIGWIELFDSEP